MEGSDSGSHLEEIRFRVPRKWKQRLELLAREQAISVADLVRIFLRESLYGRGPGEGS